MLATRLSQLNGIDARCPNGRPGNNNNTNGGDEDDTEQGATADNKERTPVYGYTTTMRSNTQQQRRWRARRHHHRLEGWCQHPRNCGNRLGSSGDRRPERAAIPAAAGASIGTGQRSGDTAGAERAG
eukprot:gene14260-biopygen1491